MNTSKSLIRSYYDLQKMRIQTGNRIVAEIKIRLGQKPGQSEKELDEESKQWLTTMKKEFKRLSDAVALCSPRDYAKPEYKEFQILTEPALLLFAKTYMTLLDQEEHMLKIISSLVEQHPLWTHYLKYIYGCGPLMTAVILSELDPHKARHASCFTKYAGIDVVNGEGRGRKKEHLVQQTYIDANGEEQNKLGISFNPFLKTKLIGVLGSCFIKSPADKCQYRKLYDDYKHRIGNHIKHKDKTKKHRHNMAVRYMIRIFLQDLWVAWRQIEGLEITEPYAVAKLGMKKHGA